VPKAPSRTHPENHRKGFPFLCMRNHLHRREHAKGPGATAKPLEVGKRIAFFIRQAGHLARRFRLARRAGAFRSPLHPSGSPLLFRGSVPKLLFSIKDIIIGSAREGSRGDRKAPGIMVLTRMFHTTSSSLCGKFETSNQGGFAVAPLTPSQSPFLKGYCSETFKFHHNKSTL
jgi:hypothetical protein